MVNFEKCTGCKLCEMACSQGHFNLFSSVLSTVRVLNQGKFYEFYPQVCTQCVDAFCVRACPTGALSRKNGVVIYEKKKCIMCRQCNLACPWGFIYPDPELQFMIKCDLCGGDPKCVKVCLNDAIVFAESTEIPDVKHYENIGKVKGGQ